MQLKEEALNCRRRVSLFDMSYFGKYYLVGADAQRAADWLFSADLRRPVGVYACERRNFSVIGEIY